MSGAAAAGWQSPHAGQPERSAPPCGRGWYPDPFGRYRARWSDGRRWTEYVADPEVGWDAVPFEHPAPQAPMLPGIGAAALGFGSGLCVSALARFALSTAGDAGGRVAELLAASLGLWIGLTAACVYVSRRRGTGSLVEDFGLRFRWRDVGFGFAGSLVARMLAISAVAPLPFPLPSRRIGEAERVVFEDALDTGWELAVVALVTCVGAPLFEELFFRGLVQGRLEARLGVVPGIVVTSLLFGAAHLTAWEGPWTLAFAWAVAAGGVVLGIMRHVSGHLGPPIAAHAFFNAQVMIAVALLP